MNGGGWRTSAQATLEHVRGQLAERSALFRKQRKAFEDIRSERTIVRRSAILTSIPGIEPTTAATLLPAAMELGNTNVAGVADSAGVAPMSRDAGTTRGRRMIRNGHIAARSPLYRTAVVAVRWNRDLAASDSRLCEAGKPFSRSRSPPSCESSCFLLIRC